MLHILAFIFFMANFVNWVCEVGDPWYSDRHSGLWAALWFIVFLLTVNY